MYSCEQKHCLLIDLKKHHSGVSFDHGANNVKKCTRNLLLIKLKNKKLLGAFASSLLIDSMKQKVLWKIAKFPHFLNTFQAIVK